MENKKYIPVIKRGEAYKIYIEKVMLIEQEARKTMIRTEGETYSMYGKIDDLLQYLDENFLKCHQSCIINLNKVEAMKAQMIIFESGFVFKIGRDKFQYVRQSFTQYLLKGH